MIHTSQTCISDEQNEMWHLELARNLNCHTPEFTGKHTQFTKRNGKNLLPPRDRPERGWENPE